MAKKDVFKNEKKLGQQICLKSTNGEKMKEQYC